MWLVSEGADAKGDTDILPSHTSHFTFLKEDYSLGITDSRIDQGSGSLFSFKKVMIVNPEIQNILKPENIKSHLYSHTPSQACEGMFSKLDSQD